MFDIDGTLVDSEEFDSVFYENTVVEILDLIPDNDWSKYKNITDTGILHEIIETNKLENGQQLIERVKNKFIEHVSEYLRKNTLNQIPGANSFLEYLKTLNNVSISIATGGWLETALLKLESAEINIEDIPITSSNDHINRTEIMKIAETRSNFSNYRTKTYFGDREWDKRACEELDYNFVLVGNNTDHHQQINDFNLINDAIKYIGL